MDTSTRMSENTTTSNDNTAETICGFLTNEPEDIYEHLYDAAISCFDTFIAKIQSEDISLPKAPSNETKSHALASRAVFFTEHLLSIASKKTKTKDKWDALQDASLLLQKDIEESSALCIACVFAALAICDGDRDSSRASASAMASTLSRNKSLRKEGHSISRAFLRTMLIHAAHSDCIKLHIMAHFARGFHITGDEHAIESAAAIEKSLSECGGSISMDDGDSDIPVEVLKERISGLLVFAVQVPPWPHLNPLTLVEAGIPLDYWQGAETVCKSAAKYKPDGGGVWSETTRAVHGLIDSAIEGRLYRRADNFSSSLYECGGAERYIEARYLHACETILKVIKKRQLPLVERQVERIDRSVDKVASDGITSIFLSPEAEAAKDEIRTFALTRLEDEGESDAIHRLADMWGRQYVYDEEAMQAAAERRRKMYIQWEDVLNGRPPNLISTPEDLLRSFHDMCGGSDVQNLKLGFDVEWEDTVAGASLLQVSTLKTVLLIDVPVLSMTNDGAAALEQTIGRVFRSDTAIVMGFSCRQDISRLKSSPTSRSTHWLTGANAVVDIQEIAAKDTPKLKRLGLSRVCGHYLGKPLDKAEQCSMWHLRPLSEKQRIYAALDAWTCVKIYDMIKP